MRVGRRWWFFGVLEPGSLGPDLSFDAAGWIAVQNFRLGVSGFQEAVGLPMTGVLDERTVAEAEIVFRRGGMLSEHFHLDEFRCTHCGRARAHRDLIDLLERIRNRLNAPMGKDSSYRCEEHPLSLRNPASEHRRGRAWDPAPDFPRSIARQEQARGIGFAAADNARCTHVDVGIGGAGWMPRPAEFVDN